MAATPRKCSGREGKPCSCFLSGDKDAHELCVNCCGLVMEVYVVLIISNGLLMIWILFKPPPL